MPILLLGGQSPRHYDWVRKLAPYLTDLGHEVIIHDYAHWLANKPDIALEAELSAVCELASQYDSYNIVGKSIGTVLAVLGTARGLLHPRASLLMGLPLTSWGEDETYIRGLRSMAPARFLQNDHDPLGDEVMLKQALGARARTDAVFVPGASHDYRDFYVITQQFAAVSDLLV